MMGLRLVEIMLQEAMNTSGFCPIRSWEWSAIISEKMGRGFDFHSFFKNLFRLLE